jgi:hypothetical protein
MNNVLVAELAKVLPVVVGAATAILASYIASHLEHRLTEKREIAKTRREKIEALVRAVYSHDQWLAEKQRLMVWQREMHYAVNPLDDARMLQALYFPELRHDLAKVWSAQVDLMEIIHEQSLKHLKNREEFLGDWHSAPFDEAYRRYIADVKTLVDRARSLLDRH